MFIKKRFLVPGLWFLVYGSWFIVFGLTSNYEPETYF